MSIRKIPQKHTQPVRVELMALTAVLSEEATQYHAGRSKTGALTNFILNRNTSEKTLLNAIAASTGTYSSELHDASMKSVTQRELSAEFLRTLLEESPFFVREVSEELILNYSDKMDPATLLKVAGFGRNIFHSVSNPAVERLASLFLDKDLILECVLWLANEQAARSEQIVNLSSVSKQQAHHNMSALVVAARNLITLPAILPSDIAEFITNGKHSNLKNFAEIAAYALSDYSNGTEGVSSLCEAYIETFGIERLEKEIRSPYRFVKTPELAYVMLFRTSPEYVQRVGSLFSSDVVVESSPLMFYILKKDYGYSHKAFEAQALTTARAYLQNTQGVENVDELPDDYIHGLMRSLFVMTEDVFKEYYNPQAR